MDIWYFELWCAGENYYIKAVQYKLINTIIISIGNYAIREKLRDPGRALDCKAKDLIGSDQTLLFISQS